MLYHDPCVADETWNPFPAAGPVGAGCVLHGPFTILELDLGSMEPDRSEHVAQPVRRLLRPRYFGKHRRKCGRSAGMVLAVCAAQEQQLERTNRPSTVYQRATARRGVQSVGQPD